MVVQIYQEEIDEAKTLVLDVNNEGTIIKMPVKEYEAVYDWTVVFQCLREETNGAGYPMQEEIQTLFQNCWDRLQFIFPGVRNGTVEVLF